MIGMVMQPATWETSAIPEPTLVSFPSAPGITMGFRPKGILSRHIAQVAKVAGIGKSASTIKKRPGKKISRRKLAM